jgi:hypothetical protein
MDISRFDPLFLDSRIVLLAWAGLFGDGCRIKPARGDNFVVLVSLHRRVKTFPVHVNLRVFCLFWPRIDRLRRGIYRDSIARHRGNEVAASVMALIEAASKQSAED